MNEQEELAYYEESLGKSKQYWDEHRARWKKILFQENVVRPAQIILDRRAAEPEAACTALLPLVQAALVPLVRDEVDIVQIVMKHYQWAVLVDKVCDLEQQYEQMLSNAKDTQRKLREEENYLWSIVHDTDLDERETIRAEVASDHADDYRYDVAINLYVLKHDVAKCQKFEHPHTARSVRKIEAAKMAFRVKKLLSSIDGSIKTWLFRS